jgi:hypothetical protein
MPRIDVVVVSYKSRDTLRECVEPLSRLDGVTVIVVDNASPDASLEVVADLDVLRVQLGTNAGFAHGCNAGWRRGAGDHVLFLNPDARIDESSLRLLAQTLDEGPRVAIVGPLIVDERGAHDFSIRRFPRLSSTYAQAFFLHRLWPRSDWTDEVVRDVARYERPGTAEWLSGACLLARRRVLELLGGWDEGFFMYCEDKDLCRRAWESGHAVRFEPRARAVHIGGGGASGPRGELLQVLAASRIRYAQKHATRRGALAERLGVACGSATHAAIGRGSGAARRGHARALVTALRGP